MLYNIHINLHCGQPDGRYGGESLEKVSEYVDHGDGDDGAELAQVHVGQHGAEDRRKVTAHRKQVVDHLQNMTFMV